VKARGPRPGCRLWSVLAPVVVLGVVVGACGNAGATSPSTDKLVAGVGGTVSVGLDTPPTGCNPNAMATNVLATETVLAPVLPSAFVVDEKGVSELNQTLLQQAEVVSTSPQTVVYTINPKARWSDGKAVSAQDFIYAWQQQADGGISGSTADVATSRLGYADIASVKGSSNGLTVTVVFATPFSDWRMLFADLVPAHVMERVGWNPPCTSVDPTIDLSAGPYEIASVSDTSVHLERNPYWWGARPDVQELVVRFATNAAQLASWLRDGTVQVAQPTDFDPTYLNAVASSPRLQSAAGPSSTFLQLDFATLGPTTNDATVRLAIADAIDRQTLLEDTAAWADSSIVASASHLYAQLQSAYPDSSEITNSLSGTTTTLTKSSGIPPFPATADLAETTHLLTSRGFLRTADGTWLNPDGSAMVLRVGIDSGDAWASATGSDLVRQLQRAKFTVVATKYPDVVSVGNALANNQLDLAVLPMFASAYPTQAIAWYTTTLGAPGILGSQNWTNLDDPDITFDLDNAAQQLNPVTAQPIYDQVDQALWTSMAALPLFAEPWTTAWSTSVLDVVANPFAPELLWNAQNWSIGVLEPSGYSGTPIVRN
jgi:peptide/nickel transport system substrate-binding protein